MNRPPAGLCLPCELAHIRDGDTVVVRIKGSRFVWAIRLINCWCPERDTPEGKAATRYIKKLLKTAEQLYVFIPAPGRMLTNLLDSLTFDRVPGYLFVSDTGSVNELMVAAGYATATKPKKRKPKCVV